MKAPRSWPNSSLSISVGGSAAQLTLDERRVAAAVPGVQRPREQLLAGAGLAQQQDRAVVGATSFTRSSAALSDRTVADDLVEPRLGGPGHRRRRRIDREFRGQAGDLGVTVAERLLLTAAMRRAGQDLGNQSQPGHQRRRPSPFAAHQFHGERVRPLAPIAIGMITAARSPV